MRTFIIGSNTFMETGSISLIGNMKKDQCHIYKNIFPHGVLAIFTTLVKIHHIHTCLPTKTRVEWYL